MNTLGRYKLLGEIGRGPISIVYDARDLLTESRVALKLIEPSLWSPPTSAAERLRFLTEAMPEWRLKHPNIVTIHDAGDGDGRLYVAMESVEGRTLRRMLDESPRPSVARSLRIAAEIASGLAHAHEHGLLHRYLKPSNILVLADDRAKITDFGMAPLRDAALASPKHAACLGYMSPEEIRCDETIDGRSDIFSLGVVLYEMLTGKRPFGGSSPAEIMRNVLEAEPALPSAVNSDVPSDVDLLVLGMLAKNPDDRGSNAEVVARRLLELSEEVERALVAHPRDEGVSVGSAPTPSDRRPPRWTRLRLPSYAWMALILAAVGGGLVWQWQQSSDSHAVRGAAISDELAPATALEPSVLDEPPPLEAAEPEPKERVGGTRAAKPSRSAGASGGAPVRKTQPAVATLAATPALPPGKAATLVFDVSPWGEIYVDGKLQGTTPPVKSLGLPPGTHRIEVRNSAQPPYLIYATLEPGDTRRIRHAFE